MSSVFFPEPMEFVEIVCPIEAAYNVIKKIAEKGTLEVIDINANNFSKPKRFADTFMLCEDAERCLRYIEIHLKSIEGMFPATPNKSQIPILINDLNLAQIAEYLNRADSELHEKINIYQQLQNQISVLRRKLQTLRFYRPIVEKSSSSIFQNSEQSLELAMIDDSQMLLSVAGLAPTSKIQRLFRTVYRVSRRNAILHIGEADGDLIPFAIFVSSSNLQQKVIKICESFTTHVYSFHTNDENLATLDAQIQSEIIQTELVLKDTVSSNIQFLKELSLSFWAWRIFIAREKQIWQTMDFGDFDRIESTVVYQAWTPKRLSKDLLNELQAAALESGTPVPVQIDTTKPEDHPDLVIPTFIETNSFTKSFQTLNNAYGVPNYDEINGGAFYCMYPFLFGVMFGDIGHSIFYILAAIALLILDPIVKKKNIDLGEIGGSVFGFKWLLFFASICALYCGFIYNECFGLPFTMFKSNWVVDVNESTTTLLKWKQEGEIYKFGIDSAWYFKDNELIFLNSYKMKISVVLGMCQMIFGMFLQLINHIHRRDKMEIILVWLPQMLYLVPFFGYLVVIIIVKWCTEFKSNPDYPLDQQENGVNLIQMMISMILSMGQKDETLQLYKEQWPIQTVIVILFIASIPCLLFLKPIYQCIKLRGDPKFNVIEIFVMNLIGVIEFCLGALSHTASYLRLWALSLAHSQLSHVIYEELFVMTLDSNNFVLLFVGFAAFCTLSAAILLAMEAFSALLHAIRLMWVEFSSKFYAGMGTQFKPVSFNKVLKNLKIRN
ncbi:vacuolar proton translocating ATPase [Tritrichomonas foetus]|uniref:V-type proton ATPase subunit a n=1 Tax=Tritrichomonas foetus TaxID=1144522 RepID=A0A1J4JUZ4_9EUKA|nr:vacuolar proton translocating ATPase [Tritrichomonas foetus]|eukprot:OHT02264.1 vacuolar proton translocating ATPase [Tritrichomonas foetus]